MQDLLFVIKKALVGRKPRLIENLSGIYHESAVLIPVFKHGPEYTILLTKRTSLVEAHKGQISFPGGTVDSTDASFEQTALREAFEEIGLRHQDVEVLGRLDDILTMTSQFIIHPFIGSIPYPYEFRINAPEVAELIKAPLEVFLKAQTIKDPGTIEFEGRVYTSLTYTFKKHVIWGATARIIKNLVEIISEKIDLPGASG